MWRRRTKISDREVALRLATDKEIDRKLRTLSNSRFFWFYSISLWNPDAFWKCFLGAAGIASIGLAITSLIRGSFNPPIVAAGIEYFLLGLILTWLYNLGEWLHPTNLIVIFTFIFALYRKNLTVDDLSADQIRRLFPYDDPGAVESRGRLARLFVALRQSSVIAPLAIGVLLAILLVAFLVLSTL